MPIEIKELHIRVTVSGGAAGPASRANSTAGGREPGAASVDKDELVAACVEQVLEVLRTRKER
jgi:hypothetical protein